MYIAPNVSWTVVQLKDKLRELGLPVSGNKADLINRIRAYQRRKSKSPKRKSSPKRKKSSPKRKKSSPKRKSPKRRSSKRLSSRERTIRALEKKYALRRTHPLMGIAIAKHFNEL